MWSVFAGGRYHMNDESNGLNCLIHIGMTGSGYLTKAVIAHLYIIQVGLMVSHFYVFYTELSTQLTLITILNKMVCSMQDNFLYHQLFFWNIQVAWSFPCVHSYWQHCAKVFKELNWPWINGVCWCSKNLVFSYAAQLQGRWLQNTYGIEPEFEAPALQHHTGLPLTLPRHHYRPLNLNMMGQYTLIITKVSRPCNLPL